MNDERKPPDAPQETDFSRKIAKKAARKLKLQRSNKQGVWFGLGMTGLIGWSVVVPTVMGAWLGIWLDQQHPGARSWTLTLMLAGLVLGCANAWHWIAQQDRQIHDDKDEPDNE